jgi:hypothetical protein
MVEAVDYPFFFANGLVLLTVTFVPFPTAVVAEHLNTPEAGAAVAFYCATFVPNSLSWNLLLYTICRGNLFKEEVTPEVISRLRGSYAVCLPVYLVATAVSFYQPWLGLAINLAPWILWLRLGYHSKAFDTELRQRRTPVTTYGLPGLTLLARSRHGLAKLRGPTVRPSPESPSCPSKQPTPTTLVSTSSFLSSR